MQELAPTTTASPQAGTCPSAEDLAAYIDGALDKAEAGRITAHLADCEDCYAVYSETLRFLLESEPEEGGGMVVPFPDRVPQTRPFEKRPLQRYYRIAALLLVGVGAGTILHQLVLGAPPKLKTLEIATRIPTRPEVFDNTRGLWTGPVYRGGEGEPEGNLDEAAFRAGVQLVNLQVSLRAEKKDEAQNAVAAMLGLLESGLLTDDLKTKYSGLTGSLQDSGKPAGSFAAEADRLAQETREVFVGSEASLDLGQWVEAGRMAAAAKDPTFFQDGSSRGFTRHLLWRDKLGLGETRLSQETRGSLEAVSRIVSKGELAASDYARLTEELGRILEEHYPAAG
jgi:putative zinc finger protein